MHTLNMKTSQDFQRCVTGPLGLTDYSLRTTTLECFIMYHPSKIKFSKINKIYDS